MLIIDKTAKPSTETTTSTSASRRRRRTGAAPRRARAASNTSKVGPSAGCLVPLSELFESLRDATVVWFADSPTAPALALAACQILHPGDEDHDRDIRLVGLEISRVSLVEIRAEMKREAKVARNDAEMMPDLKVQFVGESAYWDSVAQRAQDLIDRVDIARGEALAAHLAAKGGAR